MSGERNGAIKREKRHKRDRYQNLSESSLMPLRSLKSLIILSLSQHHLLVYALQNR